jgi:CubicO group peptidase (beta-lactamase class C family)
MHEQLDAVLRAGIARGAAPGAAAVIVDRDGVRYEGAAGERSLGSGVVMTPDTVGALFSMTKALTGTAAMQLVERGLLDLDGPAGAVCPEVGEVAVLDGFDEAGQIDRFWGGSAEALVAGLVDHAVLTPQQLERLTRRISEARKQSKGKA